MAFASEDLAFLREKGFVETADEIERLRQRDHHRNAILESAALVAEQIDDCRSSTYDNGCTDDGYRQAKNQIAEAIRSLKA